MLRREFGLTEEELLDKWDFWQTVGYMDAATDILEVLNQEPNPASSVNPEAQVLDARKTITSDQLKILGFNVAEEGGD